MRHLLLQKLLTRARLFPWHAVHSLDDATARTHLRRIGGGWLRTPLAFKP
jgi:hypothetical protein